MIWLPAACRNTSVKRTTGTSSHSIKSFRTLPGPTDGSWSTSPTRIREARLGTAFKDAVHHHYVDHRGFVHDYQVAIERVGLIAGELPRDWLHLQQAVDGFCLHTRRLRQTLRRSASGRTQQAFHALGPENRQDRIHQGRLAHAGTTGNDHYPAGESRLEGAPLAGSQCLAHDGGPLRLARSST